MLIKMIAIYYVLFISLLATANAGSQFSSHISVNTPAKSYSHGVGNPVGQRRSWGGNTGQGFKHSARQAFNQNGGYPRVKPQVPFLNEEIPRQNSLSPAPWKYNVHSMGIVFKPKYKKDTAIPVLPPSPYKVDSPDPESLWPEGLFLPPIKPTHFGPIYGRRSDSGQVLSASKEPLDPYLLEGSEAIAAVVRADEHGLLFFHDIPHIESLLANNELRTENSLKPHRLGSIRHTWPYFRP